MAQILGSWDNLKRVLFLKIAKERIFFFFFLLKLMSQREVEDK